MTKPNEGLSDTDRGSVKIRTGPESGVWPSDSPIPTKKDWPEGQTPQPHSELNRELLSASVAAYNSNSTICCLNVDNGHQPLLLHLLNLRVLSKCQPEILRQSFKDTPAPFSFAVHNFFPSMESWLGNVAHAFSGFTREQHPSIQGRTVFTKQFISVSRGIRGNFHVKTQPAAAWINAMVSRHSKFSHMVQKQRIQIGTYPPTDFVYKSNGHWSFHILIHTTYGSELASY
ncbi:hypothetical protein DFS33DRAFT_1413280 [Desarmillaria ectypa]|nr:hypothetical protein DFS33DRAFT_1413280 [Desarmillaria ectypa]